MHVYRIACEWSDFVNERNRIDLIKYSVWMKNKEAQQQEENNINRLWQQHIIL